MKYQSAIVAAGLALLVSGCANNRGPVFGARELVPPQKGIYVGSLYYAPERPTSRLETPTTLEQLCDVEPDLTRFGVANPASAPVADINLLYDTRLQGTLSGLQTTLASVGLSGSISDYYEYKLTNVSKYTISDQSAERVFEALVRQRSCSRAIDRRSAYGIYQVQATYVGDIVFERKKVFGGDASVSVKLKAIEPTIKASFSRTLGLQFSGKGLVFSFVPIVRNPGGSVSVRPLFSASAF